MSRETKLIIYGLIIVFSVIYKRVNVIMNSVPLEIATEKPAFPTFEYKGAQFTLKQVQDAAADRGMSFDDYISKFKITPTQAEPPGKLPANEEALNILFNLAVNEGYTKDLDAFRELMANDEEARAAAFDLAVEDGYTKDINAFTELVGGGVPVKLGVDPGKANVQSAGVVDYPRPQQGFSPYDEYFGRGIYDKSVGNEFVIKNSNSTDAVVLLVNAYTKRKTRNEYIRKGATFKMTSVPNGTYYLEWTSGEAWNPNLYLGKVRGGFQENSSYAKTGDRNDWMQVSGWDQWTVTLYTTIDGDVNLEDINANEFGK